MSLNPKELTSNIQVYPGMGNFFKQEALNQNERHYQQQLEERKSELEFANRKYLKQQRDQAQADLEKTIAIDYSSVMDQKDRDWIIKQADDFQNKVKAAYQKYDVLGGGRLPLSVESDLNREKQQIAYGIKLSTELPNMFAKTVSAAIAPGMNKVKNLSSLEQLKVAMANADAPERYKMMMGFVPEKEPVSWSPANLFTKKLMSYRTDPSGKTRKINEREFNDNLDNVVSNTLEGKNDFELFRQRQKELGNEASDAELYSSYKGQLLLHAKQFAGEGFTGGAGSTPITIQTGTNEDGDKIYPLKPFSYNTTIDGKAVKGDVENRIVKKDGTIAYELYTSEQIPDPNDPYRTVTVRKQHIISEKDHPDIAGHVQLTQKKGTKYSEPNEVEKPKPATDQNIPIKVGDLTINLNKSTEYSPADLRKIFKLGDKISDDAIRSVLGKQGIKVK